MGSTGMTEITKEALVEALIFASAEPVSARKIAVAAELAPEVVDRAVEALNESYEREGRAFRICAISEGYQHRTLPEFAEPIRNLVRQVAQGRMSLAALETLAIIAYRQPISRPEIDKIRGVNVSGVLKTLIERKLVTVTGRAQVVGRPLMYGTTPQFLRHFGLADLDHLPKESELQVLLTAGPEAGSAGPAQKQAENGAEQQVLM
jgi:segregation and condensation protein B